ncbi:MAG: hypothetical protein IIX78_02810 [Alistipes sp.]|nr:hypothetical protein [Alistipes sp.]
MFEFLWMMAIVTRIVAPSLFGAMHSLYGSTLGVARLLAQTVTSLSQSRMTTPSLGRLSVARDAVCGCRRIRFAQKLWDAGVKTAPVPNPG